VIVKVRAAFPAVVVVVVVAEQNLRRSRCKAAQRTRQSQRPSVECAFWLFPNEQAKPLPAGRLPTAARHGR